MTEAGVDAVRVTIDMEPHSYPSEPGERGSGVSSSSDESYHTESDVAPSQRSRMSLDLNNLFQVISAVRTSAGAC